MRCLALLALLLFAAPAKAAPAFTDAERAAVAQYWSTPGRYRAAAPPEAAKSGPWQVRLTPEGSLWFHTYLRQTGQGKLPPNLDVKPTTEQMEAWEVWIAQKVAYDRWQAQATADAANAPFGFPPAAPATPVPAVPGPIPSDLLAALGNPPPFANTVAPLLHTVTFDDGDAYEYPDNVTMRERFAYYRFPHGTRVFGTMLRDMPAAELDALFQAAGLNASEQRIARAVSLLEGGFEAVNTYDTGFVSIGFIQFIFSSGGKASLTQVLAREKRDRPEDFQQDFRRFGIDVVADPEDNRPVVVVVDPSTGAELVGAPAVQRIIADKRLTAPFQRAGRRSTAFRVAQILSAKENYWPSDDPIRIKLGETELTGKVSDVVRSEAGVATLFDRKVNRGTVAPLAEVVQKLMEEKGLKQLSEVAPYEREIVAALKYRHDFLADQTLGQP